MKKLILNSFKNMLKYGHYLMCSMSPVSESGDIRNRKSTVWNPENWIKLHNIVSREEN